MTLGTAMAGWGDLNFHFSSYLLAMGSCVLHAAYLVCVKKFELRDAQVEMQLQRDKRFDFWNLTR
jgi:hypothetical protein